MDEFGMNVLTSRAMVELFENWSRRSFIKGALAGTAGAITAEAMLAAGGEANPRAQGGRAQDEGEGQAEGEGLTKLSLGEAAELVRRKKVSPVELTQACLARIAKLNPTLNAFITVTADAALAQAREAEAEVKRGKWRGPLHGIPLALKDLFDTAGVRTTAASALFKDRVPTEDAEVVRRLKAAGAVLVGKTNMHEFAYGGTSVTSYFGAVHNPWDPGHIAGGSSGGSAAAVAAELCYGALGSDTAGSIRLPAAFCGVPGLKPTYGLVSTRGVIPLSWSLDHVGPMTRTVADAAVLLQAIAGYDAAETSSEQIAIPDYSAAVRGKVSSMRLGVPRDFFFAGLDPEIDAAVKEALAVLGKLTASVRDITLPADAQASGQEKLRAAVRSAEAYAYHAEYVTKTPELYQAETLGRLRADREIGTITYIQARNELARIRRNFGRAFESVDAMVTPTTPVSPPTIAEVISNSTKAVEFTVINIRNTSPFDVYGVPTISIPCGFTAAGLPIGLQISGPHGAEATVLRIAHAYEQATEWHKRRPGVGRS